MILLSLKRAQILICNKRLETISAKPLFVKPTFTEDARDLAKENLDSINGIQPHALLFLVSRLALERLEGLQFFSRLLHLPPLLI